LAIEKAACARSHGHDVAISGEEGGSKQPSPREAVRRLQAATVAVMPVAVADLQRWKKQKITVCVKWL
jgi:hypothetical protein